MDGIQGEPVFQAKDFRRGFSREQIVAHLERVVAIVEELDPPADLRLAVFSVVQAMEASMQPVEQKVARLADVPSGAFRGAM